MTTSKEIALLESIRDKHVEKLLIIQQYALVENTTIEVLNNVIRFVKQTQQENEKEVASLMDFGKTN